MTTARRAAARYLWKTYLVRFFLVCHPLRGGFARRLAGKSLKTFHWNGFLTLPLMVHKKASNRKIGGFFVYFSLNKNTQPYWEEQMIYSL